MGLKELAVRLNDGEYTNWLKAGRCLLLLRDGLQPFITQTMTKFHTDLLNQNALLREPCEASSCRPRGNTLSSPCRACSEWQTEILRHHRQHPRATVNWDNCSPPRWRTDHWEVAKAYMPRGQGKVKGANQCDASALLNLLNCCGRFRSVDPKSVREVIHYRNELMHSCELLVKDEWMRRYQTALKNLVRQFHHKEMAAAGRQIEEMLSADLSICVSGLDQMDSADLDGLESDSVSQSEASLDSISKWEAELLQERLHEFLRPAAAADDDNADTKTQDAEQLKSLGGFLQANRDLSERFSAELQAINSLQARE